MRRFGSPLPKRRHENLTVLCLSDEIQNDEDLPKVRDSIVLSELDDAVTIAEARAFALRTGRVNGLTVSNHPNELALSNRSPNVSNTISPTRKMDQSRRISQQSPREFTTNLPRQEKHKLMAVTEEEEALLEMIRGKRAITASNSFAQGYKTALLSSPQSPMFRRLRSASEGSASATPVRSLSLRGGEAVITIVPPLSPPPSAALPDTPEEDGDGAEDKGVMMPRHAKFDSTSSVASSRRSDLLASFPNPAPRGTLHPGAGDGPAPASPSAISLSPSNGSQASAPQPPSPQTPPPSGERARVGGDGDGELRIVVADGSSGSGGIGGDRASDLGGAVAAAGGPVVVLDVLDAAREGKSLTEALADASSRTGRGRVGAGAGGRWRAEDEDDAGDEEEDARGEARPPAYSRKKPPMLSVKLSSYRHREAAAAAAPVPGRQLHKVDDVDPRSSVVDDVMAAWNSLGGYSLSEHCA
jgi:hypothetical protein